MQKSILILFTMHLCTPVAFAQSYTKINYDPSSIAAVERSNRSASTQTIAVSHGRESMKSAASTVALIMSLAVSEGIRQKLHVSQLSQQDLKRPEVIELSKKIATEVVNSPSLAAALLAHEGASKSGKFLGAKAYSALVSTSASRSILTKTVSSGALTILTLGSFTVANQAVRMARERMKDEDYERSGHLWNMVSGSVGSVVHPTVANKNDARILGNLVGNVYDVTVKDSALQKRWLYDSWRMNIATGDSAFLLGMAGAGAAAGTTFLPGPGTATGLIGGVAGGMAAEWLVPEKYKDNLTDLMSQAHQKMIDNNLAACKTNLRDRLTLVKKYQPGPTRECRRLDDLEFALTNCQKQRDNFVSTQADYLYPLSTRMQKTKNEIALATASNNQKPLKELNEKLKTQTAVYAKALLKTGVFYKQQSEMYTELMTKTENPQFRLRMEDEIDKLDLIQMTLSTAMKELDPTIELPKVRPRSTAIEKYLARKKIKRHEIADTFLTRIYLEYFNEDRFSKEMGITESPSKKKSSQTMNCEVVPAAVKEIKISSGLQ